MSIESCCVIRQSVLTNNDQEGGAKRSAISEQRKSEESVNKER